jgi:TetR/AcrR family transcriptional repressor of nem operon
MARPKEFDPDQALDRAVELFWRKGYEATSIQDLVEALGINRSSLYGTFGDKHALYLAAIDRYCEDVVAPRVAELDQAASPRAAIRQLFLSIPTRATRRRERRGCLLCNAAVERAPVDAKVQAEVMSGLGRLGTALRRALLRARAAGEIAPSIDPAALADYLLSSYVGLIVIAKAGRKPAQLRRTAELVLKALAPG